MQLPVKEHMARLEAKIQDLMAQLQESKKNKLEIKLQMGTYEEELNGVRKEIEDYVLEKAGELQEVLKKVQETELKENNFLKMQVGQVQEDKVKVQQNALVLQNQIAEVEKDMGYRYYYD